MPEYRRAFFALWPDLSLAARLHALVSGASGRLSQPEDIHLTLAFVGDVSTARLEALQAVASAIPLPACELAIDQIGFWPHNRVVWAGPGMLPDTMTDFVTQLHTGLREAGFSLEERRFAPHLTLIRKAAADSTGRCVGPLPWSIRAWHLAASAPAAAGSRYQRIRSWPAV